MSNHGFPMGTWTNHPTARPFLYGWPIQKPWPLQESPAAHFAQKGPCWPPRREPAGDAGAWASHELGAVGSVEGKVGKVILGCNTLPPWLDDIYSYFFLSCTPSTVWSKAVSCLCLNPRARLNSKAFEIGACWFQLSRGEHFMAVGPVRRTTTGGT